MSAYDLFHRPSSLAAAVALTALAFAPTPVRAVNGTWDGGGSSGIWGGVNNWNPNGQIADGIGSTVLFGSAFANGYTITLNTVRTIGTFTFTDPANANNMVLAKHADDFSLTLNNSGASPVVNVTQSARTLTISTRIAGTAGLTKSGPGTLILNTNNTLSGALIISAGTLSVGAGGTVGSIDSIAAITNNAALVFNRSDAAAYANSISGAGSLTKLGAGTLTLSGTNTYGGGTTISAGTLSVGAGGTAGSINNSVGITNNAALVFNRSDAVAYANPISGTGSLNKLGAGTLTLSGASTYSGGTTNSAGIIIVTNSATALGTGPVTFPPAGGVRLAVGAGLEVTNAIIIGGGGAANRGVVEPIGSGTATISGPISISGSLVGGGHFAGISGGILHVKGVITSSVDVAQRLQTVIYSGGGTGYTALKSGGTIQVGADDGIATGATVGLGEYSTPGVLDLNGFNQSLVGVTKSANSATITNSSTTPAVLTLTGSTTTNFSGPITDNALGKISLTVNGGNVTLSGVNTYSGATTISAGKLTFSTAGSAASDVTVAGSATNVVLVATPGGQWVNTGNLSNDNSSVLEIDYGSTVPSTTTAPINVNNFSVGTGLTLKVVSLGFSAGQDYPLVTWTGSGPASTNAFTTLDLPTSPAVTGYLTNSGTTLYLHVVTVADKSWATGNGDWDTTTTNWVDVALAPSTYNDLADAVLFGDAAGASGNPVVNLASVFSPLGVKMNSSSHDYTITNIISGTGSIGGGGTLILDAANTRTLTLATANSYTGGTVVGGGTLALGGEGTLGSTAGSLTLSGGRLDLGGLASSKGAVSITAAAASGETITNGTLAATSFDVSNPGGTAIISASLGGSGAFTKSGAGTAILSGTNTFSGAITVSGGELDLVNWGGSALGTVMVAGGAGATLGISGSATYSIATRMSVSAATGNGTVNQTGGTVSFTASDCLLVGTGGGAGGSGTYNLSGGTLTNFASATRGVILGVNAGCSGTFNLSGTGHLNIPRAILQVARSDSTAPNCVALFNQTGGMATVGMLAIGGTGATSTNNTATLSLTAGTFAATNFTKLALGNNDVVAIHIGGTADVTLPAFPAARGAGATATITFDGGTLRPLTNSATYMGGLTSAKIKAGGAAFNVDGGKSITITQALLTDDVSMGGGLTKDGGGILILSGTNTYTGGTAVNAGELKFSTAGSATTDITVAGSATSGVIVAAGGGQWVNAGSLTNNDSSAVAIDYGITPPSTSTAPIQVSSFSVGTGLTLKVVGVGFNAGQDYPLVTWTGSGPANTNAFATLDSPNLAGHLAVSGNTLYLHVTTVLYLSWNTGNGDWDTTTPNWVDSAANPTNYTDLADLVLFNDAAGASGNPTVNLASAYSPLEVTMKSSSHDYTISGTGRIGGSGQVILDAANTRTLTLATTNTYSGGTTVRAGTLITSLGTNLNSLGTGPVSIGSGATNQINNVNTGTAAPVLGNTFTGSGRLTVNFAANTTARNTTIPNVTNFNGTIQLANLGTTGDKWSAAALGTVPGSLVVDSGSTIYASSGAPSFTGGITLNGAGNSEGRGAIRLAGATTTLGGNISLASSASISMENTAAQLTGDISSSVAGAHALTFGATGSAGGLVSGNISDGTGTITITQSLGAYTLSGDLSHGGGVNVISGVLTLSGTNNTYTGITTIGAGAGRGILVTTNNALGSTGTGNETTIAGTVGSSGAWLRFLGGINYTTTEKIIGFGYGDGRGFIQGAGGSNTFAGNIELSADGNSRIGTQNGAQLALTGAITQGSGITTANILFRAGDNAGDFVTLANPNNSFGGDSTVYSAATGGNWAGLRLGVDNAHPTNLTIANYVSSSGNATALDLNGKQQTLNGLANGGLGTLNIINLDTVNDATLTLNPTVNKTNAGTMAILGGGSLGGINLVKDGAFTQTLTGSGTLVNGYPTASNSFSGNITVNGGALGAAASAAAGTNLTVLGTATNSRTITVNPGATLTFSAPNVLSRNWSQANVPTLVINGGTVGNADPLVSNRCNNALGHVILTNGTLSTSVGHHGGYGGWDINGTVTSSGNSAITSSDPTYATVVLSSAGPGLTPAYTTFDVLDGTLAISAPLAQCAGSGDERISGLIKTGPGTMILSGANTYSGATTVSNGTLLVNGMMGAGEVWVGAGAILGGSGFVGGTVTNSGLVAPGASVGLLALGADYVQTAGGALAFEIGGVTTPGTDYDQLLIGGTATLAGGLTVTTNGYAPVAGDTFLILIANGGITGVFDSTNLPPLTPATLGWAVQYTGGAVVLSVTNGLAPSTGYNAWSNLFALAQGPTGDDDGDGYANLLEYVTGANPTNGASGSPMRAARTNGVFALQFTRDTNSIDATLIVEGVYASTNDAPWTGIATNTAGVWSGPATVIENGGPNPMNVSVADTDPSATNRFLRLRVTRP